MKRHNLLVLTFLLSQTTATWAMFSEEQEGRPLSSTISMSTTEEQTYSREEAQRLQYLLLRADQAIQGLELSGPKVFLLGKSGSGKSTLFNFLIGKDLHVDAEGRLDTTDPASSIGHGINSMTSFPILGRGPDNMVFCDFPGFGDSGGPEEDLKHAYMRHKLLTGQFKILLAVDEPSLTSRADDFLNVIHALTQEIPLEHLKSSLAIVVTKQGIVRFSNPHQKLRSMLGATRTYALNEDVEELLRYLTDEDRIHSRVPFFPCPHKIECEYDSQGSKDTILDTIRSLEAMVNPKVRLHLSPHSENLIEGLAKRLNEDITIFLEELMLGVRQSCTDQLNNYQHNDNKEKLTLTVRGIRTAYLCLQQGHMREFIGSLNNLRLVEEKVNKIAECFKTLKFLKEFKDNIEDSSDTWVRLFKSNLDDTYKLIGDLFTKLGHLITHDMKETVCSHIRTFYEKIIADPALDEATKIRDLRSGLNAITNALDTLHHDSTENMVNFVMPLNMFFNQPEHNVLIEPMEKLMFLKTLDDENKPYPKEDWSVTFQPSIAHMKSLMKEQKKILNLKQENQRLEEERLRREEEARVRAEKDRQQRAEFARQAAALQQQRDAQAEVDRQARLNEIARQKEELQAYQRLAKIKEDAAQKLAQQLADQQEATRQAAAAAQQLAQQLAAQKLADQQAAAAENKRLSDIIVAQQAVQSQAAAAEAERQRQLVAEQQAKAATIQYLLSLPNKTVISREQYTLLPKGSREVKWHKHTPVFRTKK